ncbi:hypothetical protein Ancab_029089, partial [Ancistrocladus abbreviatus]
ESYVFSLFMGGLFNMLLDRLVSPQMEDFLTGRDSTASLIEKLNDQMLTIGAVLHNAQKKRHDNPFVNKWFQKLKDAVFDAEDLIDEIHTKALQQKVMESEAQNKNLIETQSRNTIEVLPLPN